MGRVRDISLDVRCVVAHCDNGHHIFKTVDPILGLRQPKVEKCHGMLSKRSLEKRKIDIQRELQNNMFSELCPATSVKQTCHPS